MDPIVLFRETAEDDDGPPYSLRQPNVPDVLLSARSPVPQNPAPIINDANATATTCSGWIRVSKNKSILDVHTHSIGRLSYALSEKIHRLDKETTDVRITHDGSKFVNAVYFAHQLLFRRKQKYTEEILRRAQVDTCQCPGNEEGRFDKKDELPVMAGCLKCIRKVNASISQAHESARVVLSFNVASLSPEAITRLWLLVRDGFISRLNYDTEDYYTIQRPWLEELVSICRTHRVYLQLRGVDIHNICRHVAGFDAVELILDRQRVSYSQTEGIYEECVYRVAKVKSIRVVVKQTVGACVFVNSRDVSGPGPYIRKMQRLIHERGHVYGCIVVFEKLDHLDIVIPWRLASNLPSFLLSIARTYASQLPDITVRYTGERKNFRLENDWATDNVRLITQNDVKRLKREAAELRSESAKMRVQREELRLKHEKLILEQKKMGLEQVESRLEDANVSTCLTTERLYHTLECIESAAPAMFARLIKYDSMRRIQEIITTTTNAVFIASSVLPAGCDDPLFSDARQPLLDWLEARFSRDAAFVETVLMETNAIEPPVLCQIILEYAYMLKDNFAYVPEVPVISYEEKTFLPRLVLPERKNNKRQVVELSDGEDTADDEPVNTASRSDGKEAIIDDADIDYMHELNQITRNDVDDDDDDVTSSQAVDPSFDPNVPSDLGNVPDRRRKRVRR